MLEHGKMMSREGNPSLTLFPKKYDHAESTRARVDTRDTSSVGAGPNEGRVEALHALSGKRAWLPFLQ